MMVDSSQALSYLAPDNLNSAKVQIRTQDQEHKFVINAVTAGVVLLILLVTDTNDHMARMTLHDCV